MLSFGIWIHGRGQKGGGGGSDLGKGRKLPVPNIPGDEWENRSTRGNKSLVGCSENPVILILMRVSLPSKLRKTKQWGGHIHAHTL